MEELDVLVQTLCYLSNINSHNLTLNELIKNRSDELLMKELIIRENNLPPFVRLIAIIVSSKDSISA